MVEKEVTNVEIWEQLIEQVMSSCRLVQLYNPDDKETKYTTKEVREEELRLLRIASTVKEQVNYKKIDNLRRDIQVLNNVSEVQREALSSILLTNQGVRILRGRAGAGKSHVLGIAYKLATNYRQNVIGLAPTHKAASELKNKGYQECDTVKGFLFKLYNGKINLPYNSLLVVDEAGMVATLDYLELFKVARKYDCQVILAGDERQLASVERSGMFEVFADKFGSYVLSDIRRQSQDWGREMAMCFATGNITDGIKLLEKNEGLNFDHTLADSMSRLITDWHNSKFELQERLIITVRNKEVDAINKGIRKLLKEKNVLTGKEYRRTIFDEESGERISENYMVGDRIVFKTSNKELQTKNGEFATLVNVSQDKFIAKTDKGQEITFNPTDISFKHGYASTVYKGQGASIKDVYVLHNLAGNSRSSYVEMTRHVEKVGLYANIKTTGGIMGLISQLSRINDKLASINFLTIEELVQHAQDKQQLKQTILEKTDDWLKSVAVNIGDRLHLNPQYYQIEGNIEPIAKVEEVLKQTAETLTNKEIITMNDNNNQINESQEVATEKIVVDQQGEARNSNPTSYYNTYNNSYSEKNYQSNLNSQQEMTNLKQQLLLRAAEIGVSLLGEPNKRLSSSDTLRWGETGKLAMKITGSKAGVWYDFSEGKGGDLFALVQKKKNCNFFQAKEYLQDMAGMPNKDKVALDIELDKFYKHTTEQEQKAKDVEFAKLKFVQGQYENSATVKYSIPEHVARTYLSEHRGIKTVLTNDQISPDIKTIMMMWDSSSKKHYPALLAFARDGKGDLTGVQAIYLDHNTGYKANVLVDKRCFGKISGSFVEIQKSVSTNSQDSTPADNVTIIAEGVETALSIQEAGINGKILCSLGVMNIKNYQPQVNECILIAADHDRLDVFSLRTVTDAKAKLEQQGAIVSIATPPTAGDFNYVLKTQGKEAIKEILVPEIRKLAAYKHENINPMLQKLQNELKSLEKFATTENRHTALQIYKQQNMEAFVSYSHKVCSVAIEQKIKNDLVTMQNKFDPNYDLGDINFCDVVIRDFNGKSHSIPEDYLVAIVKDKQVLQYVNPEEIIGKETTNELKNTSEVQKIKGCQLNQFRNY